MTDDALFELTLQFAREDGLPPHEPTLHASPVDTERSGIEGQPDADQQRQSAGQGSRQRASQDAPRSFEPDELTTRDAAAYLTVSVDTLEKYVALGLLPRRNISPPGSGKPRYRYRLADLDRLKQDGYRHSASKGAPVPKKRRAQANRQPKTYDHLDLD